MRRIVSSHRAWRKALEPVAETDAQYRPRALSSAEIEALADKPSIIVATLPYADTKCVCQSLALTLGYEQGRSLFKGSFTKNQVVPEMAADFSLGGLVGGWHLGAAPPNIDALLRTGLSRIVLHVRDPRASALVYGRLRYFRDQPDRHQDGCYLETFVAPTDDPIFDERINGFVRKAVPWLSAWLDATMTTPALRVLMRSYEELASDPGRYFRAVLDFYGVKPEQLVIAPRDEKLTFGNGQPGAWRET
ncbi:MAG: hypothetical protein ACRECF_06800, partial [Methyloceanibacter sp.]